MGTSNKTPPPGQVLFTSSSVWLVPANVTSICGLCIGGGGNGCAGNAILTAGTGYGGGGLGGGGGALAYVNNIPVTPGEYLTITVGGVAGSSYILRGGSVLVGAGGGYSATPATYPSSPSPGAGGSVLVGTGGAGGSGITAGGYATGAGGAGGYSGAGGSGASGGSGGGGGGGGTGGTLAGGTDPFILAYYGGGGGGGVGVLGEGASGASGYSNPSGFGEPGFGGSGGATGSTGTGGLYGGGGGGGMTIFYLYQNPANSSVVNFPGYGGVSGAVRIIWGAGRAFPSTNTGDV